MGGIRSDLGIAASGFQSLRRKLRSVRGVNQVMPRAGVLRLCRHELVQNGDYLLASFCVVMRQGEHRQSVKSLGFAVVRIFLCDVSHGPAVRRNALIAQTTIVTKDDPDGVNVDRK